MPLQTKRILAAVVGLSLVAGCQAPAGRAKDKGAIRPPRSTSKAPVDDAVALHPRVKIETTNGDIICELDGENAPAPVMHFVQYLQKGYYDNTLVHRVVADSMIQGGGYTPEMESKPALLSPPMPDRWGNDLKNDRGTIALIRGRGTVGTGTAEFFINVVDNHRLDQKASHSLASVFGKVVEGLDVVDRIRDTPVTTHPKYAEGRSAVVPADPIIVKSVKLITPYEFDRIEASANARPTIESRVDAILTKLEKDTGRSVVTTESGLKLVDVTLGNGAVPLKTDSVEFQYRGTLLDGSEFESTYQRRPAVRKVADLIPGLQETLTTMKEGGKRTVIIPPTLAFGSEGIPGFIPGDSIVVFEVELLGIR